jgi:putative acetyltransferase
VCSIQPIASDQVSEAIDVIAAVVYDVYGSGNPTSEALATVRANLVSSGSLDDMHDVAGNYDRNGGLFLVLVDEARIVGTGALKRIDPNTAELGRMWFLAEYRDRGLGRRMAEQLLTFAREQNYRRVRLDTSETCVDAIALFRKLGFQEIERYKPGPTSLFMELHLSDGEP